jgi:hypothetical protein
MPANERIEVLLPYVIVARARFREDGLSRLGIPGTDMLVAMSNSALSFTHRNVVEKGF